MICKICGKEIPDDSNVCQFCGADVREGGEAVSFPKEVVPVNNDDEHVSMGLWLGIMAINLIPCVGPLIYTIMMFVWGFGDTKKKSLKTFSRAALIMMAISAVITVIATFIFIALAGGMMAIMEEGSSYYY